MKSQLLSLSLVAAILVSGCTTPSAPAAPTSKPAAQTTAAPAPAKPAEQPAKSPAAQPAAKEPAKSAAPDRNANLKALHEKARAEGEVVWKGGIEDRVKDELAAVFGQDYPGIKVTHAVVPNGQIPVQVITESSANRVSTDVAFGQISDLGDLQSRGLLVQYDWSQLIDPQGAVEFDNKLVRVFDTVSAVAYKTDVLKPDETPKTWEDLLQPRFGNGQMAFNATSSVFSGLYFERGEQAATAYLQKLREQKPVWKQRGAEAMQALVSGQVLLSAAPIAIYLDNKARQAPIAITPVSPFATSHLGHYTVKGAPHPNAALLLMAWIRTPKAQEILKKNNRTAVTPCSAGPGAQAMCEAGVKMIDLDTAEKVSQDLRYGEILEKVLGFNPV